MDIVKIIGIGLIALIIIIILKYMCTKIHKGELVMNKKLILISSMILTIVIAPFIYNFNIYYMDNYY